MVHNSGMNTKLIFKLVILIIGLIFVAMIYNYTSSGSMTRALNEMFGGGGVNKITWCADHVVDVAWVAPEVPARLKELDLPALRDRYCELKTEAIAGVDLDQVQWSTLAESSGATGIKTILEWNPGQKLFRSGGLPFKSSDLSQELGL